MSYHPEFRLKKRMRFGMRKPWSPMFGIMVALPKPHRKQWVRQGFWRLYPRNEDRILTKMELEDMCRMSRLSLRYGDRPLPDDFEFVEA